MSLDCGRKSRVPGENPHRHKKNATQKGCRAPTQNLLAELVQIKLRDKREIQAQVQFGPVPLLHVLLALSHFFHIYYFVLPAAIGKRLTEATARCWSRIGDGEGPRRSAPLLTDSTWRGSGHPTDF
ncbi:unnamed protein product [Pleuronectes platessa]|uniref:Uncharacterized protein n=1 Tax=Pleuronectes platessa TaxID=8262 RepID=A0A9N7YJ50_PLEPL|nr:unnamed protein product [Pleuronectes platessa]